LKDPTRPAASAPARITWPRTDGRKRPAPTARGNAWRNSARATTPLRRSFRGRHGTGSGIFTKRPASMARPGPAPVLSPCGTAPLRSGVNEQRRCAGDDEHATPAKGAAGPREWTLLDDQPRAPLLSRRAQFFTHSKGTAPTADMRCARDEEARRDLPRRPSERAARTSRAHPPSSLPPTHESLERPG
jgi:hypothetical protein